MEKYTFTIHEAGYLLAMKVLWPQKGYLTFYGSRSASYQEELTTFIHDRSVRGLKNRVLASMVHGYLGGFTTLFEKTQVHNGPGALQNILHLVPRKLVLVGHYDMVLRVQKGYCAGSRKALRSFLMSEKGDILGKLNMKEDIFDELILDLFDQKVMA